MADLVVRRPTDGRILLLVRLRSGDALLDLECGDDVAAGLRGYHFVRDGEQPLRTERLSLRWERVEHLPVVTYDQTVRPNLDFVLWWRAQARDLAAAEEQRRYDAIPGRVRRRPPAA